MRPRKSTEIGFTSSQLCEKLKYRENGNRSIENPFPRQLQEIPCTKSIPFLELTPFSLVSEKIYSKYDKASIRGFDDMSCRVRDLSKIAYAIPYKAKTSPEKSEIIDYRKQ